MKIQTNNLSEKDLESWNNFLRNHPHNTIFQSPEFYDFYKSVKNFSPYVFIARNDNNRIIGVLLAVIIREHSNIYGYFSSRAVIYGGPLIDEKHKNKEELLNQILKTLVKKLKYKTIFIQFRNFFNFQDNLKKIFYENGFSYFDRINLLVNTVNKDQTLKEISNSKLRQIKAGLKKGCIIRPPKDINEVRIFYEMLYNLYRYKVIKPLPGWSFFEQFYYATKEDKLGIIRLIIKEKNIIGGILSPVTPGRNIYEWYVFGLDKEYKKSYPSILATWSPIDHALNHKLDHLDFMGLGKPEEEYGVRDFKIKFGGKLVSYGRFGRKSNKIVYGIIELAYNFMRKLKRV